MFKFKSIPYETGDPCINVENQELECMLYIYIEESLSSREILNLFNVKEDKLEWGYYVFYKTKRRNLVARIDMQLNIIPIYVDDLKEESITSFKLLLEDLVNDATVFVRDSTYKVNNKEYINFYEPISNEDLYNPNCDNC